MIPQGVGRLQTLTRRLLGPLAHRLWNFRIEGLENVPKSGPAILCPNHVAAIDSMFVPTVLDRDLIYVGKAEYLDDWKTKWLFPAMGMIPIDRRGGDHATAALDAARELLRQGGLFGIYPEGTRSRSGKLHKGHTGAARLAIETGSPIVPVGILGSGRVQQVGSAMPKFFVPVTIRFGRPLEVDRYRHRIGDRAVYRELIDEVMYEIQQLTGLEYEHTYATSKAKTPATAEVPATASGKVAVSVPDAVSVPATASGPATAEPEPVVSPLGRASSADVLLSEPLVSLDTLLSTT